MARRNRQKPSDPEAARLARRVKDFGAVGLQPDSAALPAHDNIEVTRKAMDREGHKVDHDVAQRMDAFDVLKKGMEPGAFDAARRLERDMLIRRGEADHGRSLERVDCTAGFTTDRVIKAAEDVEFVTNRLAPRDWWLLVELINPRKAWTTWRETVAHITGEENANAQGACVRYACVNLRDAYEELDVGAKKAA
jgi:hypothetical protein